MTLRPTPKNQEHICDVLFKLFMGTVDSMAGKGHIFLNHFSCPLIIVCHVFKQFQQQYRTEWLLETGQSGTNTTSTTINNQNRIQIFA